MIISIEAKKLKVDNEMNRNTFINFFKSKIFKIILIFSVNKMNIIRNVKSFIELKSFICKNETKENKNKNDKTIKVLLFIINLFNLNNENIVIPIIKVLKI